ncbi:uncharacterized protein DUF2793 [Sphingomonas sp. F9_3S_D5_B_2]
MGWWFGRKSAPADASPYVPAWLRNDSAEEGFARSYEAQYDEVFRRNPVGQRAVRLVSGMLGALTIDAVEGDPRAVALIQADGLLESIAANLLLHGNAYVQLIADDRDLAIVLGSHVFENSCAAAGFDLIAAAAVEEGPRAAPPATPEVGATYIVAAGATGEWVGRDQCLAGSTDGGWRFIEARPGMFAYVVNASLWAVFRSGTWEIGAVRGDRLLVAGQPVVGPRAAAIPRPSAGSVVDTQARTAIEQILSALQTHGLIES